MAGEKVRAMIGKSKWEKEAMSKVYARGGTAEQALAYAAGTVGGGTYTVKPGDSWFSIAGDMFGNQRYFEAIMAMNGGVSMLHPGMVIKLPGIPTDAEGNLVEPTVSYDSMALSFQNDAKMGYDIDNKQLEDFAKQVGSDPKLSEQQRANLIGTTQFAMNQAGIDVDLPGAAASATAASASDVVYESQDEAIRQGGAPYSARDQYTRSSDPMIGGAYPTTGAYGAPSRAGVFGPEVASTVADVGALAPPPATYGASQSYIAADMQRGGQTGQLAPAQIPQTAMAQTGNTYGSSQGYMGSRMNQPTAPPAEPGGIFGSSGMTEEERGRFGLASMLGPFGYGVTLPRVADAFGKILGGGGGGLKPNELAAPPATASQGAPGRYAGNFSPLESDVPGVLNPDGTERYPAVDDWVADGNVQQDDFGNVYATAPIGVTAMVEKFGTLQNATAQAKIMGLVYNPFLGAFVPENQQNSSGVTTSTYEPQAGYRPRIYADPKIFWPSIGKLPRSGGGGGGAGGGAGSGGASRSYGTVGQALTDWRVGFG